MPTRSRSAVASAAALLAASTSSVFAHSPDAVAPGTIWHSWNKEPWLWAVFMISGALYFTGAQRMRSPRVFRPLCFWSGGALLAIALLTPLHALGEALASAHMLQHMLLFFAAPLVVMSSPLATFLWSLPRSWRMGLSRKLRASWIAWTWGVITSTSFAWLFHAVVLWAWHSPPFYQAALEVGWLHDLEHFSFLLSGLLLWWAIIQRARVGLLLLFTTMLHSGLLAALLTFSDRLWYPYYNETTTAWGITPLQDQQLAGMVMWVLGGFGYLLAGLFILGIWLGRMEARTRVTATAMAIDGPPASCAERLRSQTPPTHGCSNPSGRRLS